MMANRLRKAEHISVSHSINALFKVKTITYDAGKAILRFTARDRVVDVNGCRGALGCVVDCVARIAGQQLIGDCVIAECEMNFHAYSSAQEFVASAEIVSSNNNHATYFCTVYAVENTGHVVENPGDRLIAESQGTLLHSVQV